MGLGKVVIDEVYLGKCVPEVKKLIDNFVESGNVHKRISKEDYEIITMEHELFEDVNKVDVGNVLEYAIVITRHEPYTLNGNVNREYTLAVKKR